MRRYDTGVKGGERALRILVWHGWLLEGTGSNIYAAKVAEVWRRQGHEVALVCQQRFTERLAFVDVWGPVDAVGSASFVWGGHPEAPGEVRVLNPDIGDLLPVFVEDHYEGFRVKRFVDLSDRELEEYLDRNVSAIRSVARHHPPDAAVAGHLVPGPIVARRALGDGAYVAKVHGSDLEYAVRVQERFAGLAREGVAGARAVVGASQDVLRRTVEVAPTAEGRTRVIAPGVDVERWRPRLRPEALEDVAERLDADLETARGRPSDVDRGVRALLKAHDAPGLGNLARTYDQEAPDPEAADRLRAIPGAGGPVAGYVGKLIPQKGVERLLEAVAVLGPEVRCVVVGFGLGREWLAALVAVLDTGDVDGYEWLKEVSPLTLELDPDQVRSAVGLASRVTFTGRLDHRYAPEVVAATDVLVVPSILDEAFGIVAAEGAAAGAVPLVARHSSLAEVAAALEDAAGRPELLSFRPGPGATGRLAEALRRILDLPEEERRLLRKTVREHVASHWTWERTAERLLDAATA